MAPLSRPSFLAPALLVAALSSVPAQEHAAQARDGVRDGVARALETPPAPTEAAKDAPTSISDAQFEAFVEAAQSHGIAVPADRRSDILEEARKIARHEEDANFVVRYVHQLGRSLSAPAGSDLWLKGVIGLLSLAVYLYVVPKWGYGGVIRRIREGEPTDTRAFIVFAVASLLSVSNSVIDRSTIPALCIGLLMTYALYAATLNNRLRRKIDHDRSLAVDESGVDWTEEDRLFEFHARTSPCALWTKDGRVRRWSPGMEKLLGYTEAEMKACQNPLVLLYGYDPEELARASGNVAKLLNRERGSYVKVFRPKPKNGEPLALDYHTTALEDAGNLGSVKGRISIVLPNRAATASTDSTRRESDGSALTPRAPADRAQAT